MGRRRRRGGPHGLVVVDKPAGITSHDVVDQLRRRWGQRRIGHAGTLDPPATGVLVCGVGSCTRLLRFVGEATKHYEGELVLGVTTSTLDDTGEVVERRPLSGVGTSQLAEGARRLTGTIEQLPPMVSAVRQGGRRLHELAREGVEVEREARTVTIHSFEVGEPVEEGIHPIRVACSSGTYIRSLVDDLGQMVGCGAHLRGLRRTAIGSFTESEARSPDEAELLDPAEFARDMGWLEVDEAVAERVAVGAVLDLSGPRRRSGHDEDLVADDGPVAVLDPRGRLLAVYEPHRDRWKPAVVLSP